MYNYKTEPFKHQRQALREGAKDYNFAYFMEMGTGKTKVAIDNAAYLFQDKRIDFAFVMSARVFFASKFLFETRYKMQYIKQI